MMYFHLYSDYCQLTISVSEQQANIFYFGKRHANFIDHLNWLRQQDDAPASATPLSAMQLFPTIGSGFTGVPGVELMSMDQAHSTWGAQFLFKKCLQTDDHQLIIVLHDPLRQLEIHTTFDLAQQSNILSIRSKFYNFSPHELTLLHCAAVTFPIYAHFTQLLHFSGHWAKEFQLQKQSITPGQFRQQNRRGRTSHDNFPGFILCAEQTTEFFGECLGFHLGWSGDHEWVVDQHNDYGIYVQASELFTANEIQLSNQSCYQSPPLYVGYSAQGFTSLSQQFHCFVQQQILPPLTQQSLRPVHFNTWEAIYFEHNEQQLFQLVQHAADLGVERFVLDDGWFKNRTDDSKGLGDWQVDLQRYPQGLTPLITAVQAQGMQFGLWLEPEMVNPDSDLYRQHPDWILAIPGSTQLNFRQQYVLDLTQTVVQDYLFSCIQALLNKYDIQYIKWDMNRDLNHPGAIDLQPATHRQTLSLYQLLAKVRQHYPQVEIESCASGGARADYGILALTDRIWTSDNHDPQHRLSIQHGASFFLPYAILGSHIGAHHNHITQRQHDLRFRIAVALFGHFGLELSLHELTVDEQHIMRQGIQCYKQHRALLHQGQLYRLHYDEQQVIFAVMSDDHSQWLLAYYALDNQAIAAPVRVFFPFLAQLTQSYALSVAWHSLHDLGKLQTLEQQPVYYSAQQLSTLGLTLPRIKPNQSIILYAQPPNSR